MENADHSADLPSGYEPAPESENPLYRLDLPNFEGPLDLLLFLIKKHDVDILDIPVGLIAEHYLQHLEMMESLNIDVAASFLSLAAELTYIKSRMLVPQEESEEEEEEEGDPRANLVRRLLEYQKYRDAGQQLSERDILGRDTFARAVPTTDVSTQATPLAEVSLYQLVKALDRVLSKTTIELKHEVMIDKLSVADRLYSIIDRLRVESTLAFSELFVTLTTRRDIIVTFLALLEITKLKLVRMHQSSNFGEIYIQAVSEKLKEFEALSASGVLPVAPQSRRPMTINNQLDLPCVIESLLLVADRPLTVDDVVRVLAAEQEERADELGDELESAAAENESTKVVDDVTSADAGEETNELSADAAVDDAIDGDATENDVTSDDGAADPLTPDDAATPENVAAATPGRSAKELQRLVTDAFAVLLERYRQNDKTVGNGFELLELGGGLQFRTLPANAPFVRHFLQVKPTKLSRAQLETIAIIAYRQPVTRAEIEEIRGVDCGAAVKAVLDRKLIRILGKKEEVGRPLIYGTTKEFLEFFKLGSLLELPSLREFQELNDEFKKQVDEDTPMPRLSIAELSANAPKLNYDDEAALSDLDSALSSAKSITSRVSELTGIKEAVEDA